MVEYWRRVGVKKDTVVMGDINLDFKVWGQMTGQERKLVEEADNQVVASGFTQEIEEVTHRGPYRETIIDHIWNNCP